MNYEIELQWNGKIVLAGQCTATAGYDTVTGFMRGEFAGIDHAAWCKRELDPNNGQFDGILKLEPGYTWTIAYKDKTGHAQATITKPERF